MTNNKYAKLSNYFDNAPDPRMKEDLEMPTYEPEETDDFECEGEPIILERPAVEPYRMTEKEQMEFWVRAVPFKKFVEEISSKVIGQPNLNKLLLSVYIYIRNCAQGKKANSNVLLAAPSGCGKTESFRVLRTYFRHHIPNLPIVQIDMTNITQEGFKGADKNSIIEPLIERGSTGFGIVFMDEFDKKLMPSYEANGSDVNLHIQNQLLTMIEGINENGFDTNYTMFVGMGSFDACRRERAEHRSIGFVEAGEEVAKEHYADITLDDALSMGAVPEMLGRFSMLINYHKLSDADIDRVIDLLSEEVADDFNVDICLGKAFRQYLHTKANTKFGCRCIRNAIQSELMNEVEKLYMAGRNPEKGVIHLLDEGKSSFSLKKNASKKEMFS